MVLSFLQFLLSIDHSIISIRNDSFLNVPFRCWFSFWYNTHFDTIFNAWNVCLIVCVCVCVGVWMVLVAAIEVVMMMMVMVVVVVQSMSFYPNTGWDKLKIYFPCLCSIQKRIHFHSFFLFIFANIFQSSFACKCVCVLWMILIETYTHTYKVFPDLFQGLNRNQQPSSSSSYQPTKPTNQPVSQPSFITSLMFFQSYLSIFFFTFPILLLWLYFLRDFVFDQISRSNTFSIIIVFLLLFFSFFAYYFFEKKYLKENGPGLENGESIFKVW